MRINVYSQELTSETRVMDKNGFLGIGLMLHSSDMLHHTPQDDDRSAVVFWLPSNPTRCREVAKAFREIADFFEAEMTL